MDFFTSPFKDEEMSLRELVMSSMEDTEIRKIRFDACYNSL
jgi:hypothetical protein